MLVHDVRVTVRYDGARAGGCSGDDGYDGTEDDGQDGRYGLVRRREVTVRLEMVLLLLSTLTLLLLLLLLLLLQLDVRRCAWWAVCAGRVRWTVWSDDESDDDG